MQQRTILLATSALLGLVIITGPASPSATAASIETFIAVLNAGQENQDPKPASNSFGNALMTADKTSGMLCYSISFSDLTAPESAAHFHGPASIGENANVAFAISPDVSPLGSPKTGCVGPLTSKQMSDLKKGLFYINIHSTNFPGGEIRGQVLRVTGVQTSAPVAE